MNDSSDEKSPVPDSGKSYSEELRLLLAGDVLDNLEPDERLRLEEISRSADDVDSFRESLRHVAAAVSAVSTVSELDIEDLAAGDSATGDMTSTPAGNQMGLSPELIERIRRDASRYLPAASVAVEDKSAPEAILDGRVEPQWFGTSLIGSPRLGSPWIGWCVAASLALVCGWLWISKPKGDGNSSIARITSSADAAAWIDSHPSAIQLAWDVKDPSLVSGDTGKDAGSIAWDTVSQTGFMRLNRLPVNDPSVQQYQLWIIDPERDDAPIDGGVFDIAHSGESFIPIDARLKVLSPAGFAVTIEKPGGVVVSDQSRLPLLALLTR
jgi:hypothetical protein